MNGRDTEERQLRIELAGDLAGMWRFSLTAWWEDALIEQAGQSWIFDLCGWFWARPGIAATSNAAMVFGPIGIMDACIFKVS